MNDLYTTTAVAEPAPADDGIRYFGGSAPAADPVINMDAPGAEAQLATAVSDWASGAAEAPGTVIVNSGAAGLSFENLIKSASSIAKEIMTYKRESIPGGGTIYRKMDPATGRPAVSETTLKLSSQQSDAVSSFIEKNKTAIGIGLFLLVKVIL